MTKKIYNTDIFAYLDWILKKRGKEPSKEALPYPYMGNRWLSMSDPMIAQIINTTVNRWIVTDGVCTNGIVLGRFFRIILPKITKRFSYFKKATKEKDQEDYTNVASAMQISIREIENYEKTLAYINKEVK